MAEEIKYRTIEIYYNGIGTDSYGSNSYDVITSNPDYYGNVSEDVIDSVWEDVVNNFRSITFTNNRGDLTHIKTDSIRKVTLQEFSYYVSEDLPF